VVVADGRGAVEMFEEGDVAVDGWVLVESTAFGPEFVPVGDLAIGDLVVEVDDAIEGHLALGWIDLAFPAADSWRTVGSAAAVENVVAGAPHSGLCPEVACAFAAAGDFEYTVVVVVVVVVQCHRYVGCLSFALPAESYSQLIENAFVADFASYLE